jgi:flagellar biosynthetic protein FliP
MVINRFMKIFCFVVLLLSIILCSNSTVLAAPEIPIPNAPEDVVNTLEIIIILTILTLAPSILIMMTSFTRIIVILSFVRNALGTQQMPPNQVLIGLAIFLTFFIMAPVGSQINENAIQPYLERRIEQEDALRNAMEPIREFMFRQTHSKDLSLFISIAGEDDPETLDDIPNHILIPSFIISELKTAFQIGFLIFIPFIIVDMVVASTLMSMGMMMLPPIAISLPFKILLFIMVDGWNLVIKTMITGFQ